MINRIQNLPVAMFSMVMGLAGFSLAWHQAETTAKLAGAVSLGLSWLALLMFVLLLISYIVKILFYPHKVQAEFNSISQIGFFSTISVSFLLLATCFLHMYPEFARTLWLIGAGSHLALTLIIINRWIYHTDNFLSEVTPVWFIPTVGNILVPLAGIKFASSEVSWFFFSLGLLLWLIIFIMLLFRLFFDKPLEDDIIPTMFIMFAPPAVGFISWMSFSLALDFFARFLYYNALFVFLLLFSRVLGFASLPFSVSWWAYSFPLAAMIIASFKVFELTGMVFLLYFAWSLLFILSALIVYLLLRTVIEIIQGKIIPKP